MQNEKESAIKTIRIATTSKLREQEELVRRMEMQNGSGLQALNLKASFEPDLDLTGTKNFISVDPSEETMNALNMITDANIRNAVFSHLLVANHLEQLRAAEQFLKVLGSSDSST